MRFNKYNFWIFRLYGCIGEYKVIWWKIDGRINKNDVGFMGWVFGLIKVVIRRVEILIFVVESRYWKVMWEFVDVGYWIEYLRGVIDNLDGC